MAGSKCVELSRAREITQMVAEELRDLTATLLGELASRDKELEAKQLKIDQLIHEMATLKRYRFDRRSEQMDRGAISCVS
jgi:transposase